MRPFSRTFLVLLLLLTVSGAYTYAVPTPSLDHILLVLVHLGAGVVFAVVLVLRLRSAWKTGSFETRFGSSLLFSGAALGIVLLFTGALRSYQPVLFAHIGLTAAGVIVLVAGWARTRVRTPFGARAVYGALMVGVVAFSGALWAVRELGWQRQYQIRNPPMPPASMDEEGGGAQGPFFPSSAQTSHGGLIEASFFMESEACRRCHADIYQQWDNSAHHFASFNNQWYRKSIEYMQDVVGPRPSKWCGGCHDPAVLFSGLMDTPIRENLHRPEAHAGIGCVGCHSIVAVKSTMGQGDYVIEYPPLHDWATSENPALRTLHDFLINTDPEPHRRAFMKPFVRQQSAEFCSTCHKVHLDHAVNHYRWLRGFNEYDSWQASGVSGMGARAFYFPSPTQTCVDCHMPLVDSKDAGNHDGFVHSHRFPGANSALPVANRDGAQLEATQAFLQSGIVDVQIFALSSEPAATGGALAGAALESVQAPLHRVDPVVRPGDSVRVDVVVRTRKVGHAFPGGTTDAFDVWLELLAEDETGEVVFWSGRVEDEGKGPVEKAAHFYRTLQVDARSNPINKRNAWAARALVYQRLIPPGAADTVRYRIRIPNDPGREIKLTARLCYRKFAWWNTQFSYQGVRDPQQANPAVSPDYDDGRWVFTGDTASVSGKLKYAPNLPVITVAEDEVTLRVVSRTEEIPPARVVLDAGDWEAWNDYGIGLLSQADWGRAEGAFRKVTEMAPARADGWTNIGRVRLETGNFSRAREVLERALELNPTFAPAHFFYARTLQAEGRLEDALRHLRQVAAQFPRDRVVRNETGRVLFRLQRFAEAIQEFEATLAIDPEDLDAHYNLMLCYTALDQPEQARAHEQRYNRFKTEELSPALTNPYLRRHPEDNTERQPIHEHESAPLPAKVLGRTRTAQRPVVKAAPRGADGYED